ncbi:sigma-54-dependent Fis family transcriptional regulator [Pseudochelatococcus contaminans]|uniref:Transcriptional regulator of acetoin/glycerol metabolism n=1 Tax=Pseudochelatococcus contaminans TaxID=1538103 RepID=A0A7W5Z5A1_9HYPH|nr:helix-turn-helix domain-containing protein [Pseudochelatococcus contaminans]MBB3810239.1 transcriptional regulator of acetoin/glycerol metabolism [Pseudochelatococcus contaminans]
MTESIQKEDWERFRALGSVPPSIREIVLRSWVRSRDIREIETRERAPSVAQDELQAIRARNARLRNAAQAAIRRAGYMLNDAGAILLLCNPDGIVTDAAGDVRILSRGEENHLYPGGHWDEGAIGTNAIGTALHLGKPVTISGVEHFCEAIQRWSCAAAPIHDPFTGRRLGVVDISGPSGEAFAQVAILSVTLALQIEEALRSTGLREQSLMLEQLLSRKPSLSGDAVVLFDRFGRPVWSSASAGDATKSALGGCAILRELPEETGDDPHQLAERMQEALPDAGVEVLDGEGGPLGVLVSMRRSGGRSRPLSNPEISLRQIADTDPEMERLCAKAVRIVESGVPLLIEGAVGSGKETLARSLHAHGPLATRPFEIFDCSLLDCETLRAGADFSARLARLARMGGTLCLDEPAETPQMAQPLVAQALAHLVRTAAAPLQVLTLSSVCLDEKMASGELRSELHFRIAAATLRLPSLAERRDSIDSLVRDFAALYSVQRHGKPLRFTPAAMMRLRAHTWPGNLRELRNLIESLSATSLNRLIDVPDLPPQITTLATRREDSLRERERADILDAVAAAGGNMSEVARRLGISRSTLYLKLDQYGVARRRR